MPRKDNRSFLHLIVGSDTPLRGKLEQEVLERGDQFVSIEGRDLPSLKEALKRARLEKVDVAWCLLDVPALHEADEVSASSMQFAHREGPLWVAEISRALDASRLMLFSSAQVAGVLDGKVPEELLVQSAFHNQYEKTRYQGEQEVADGCRRGNLALTVMRSGILVNGSAEVGVGAGSAFYSFLMEMVALKTAMPGLTELTIPGNPRAGLHLVEWSCLPRLFLAAMDDSRDMLEVRHLTPMEPAPTAGLMEILSAASGVKIALGESKGEAALDVVLSRKANHYGAMLFREQVFAGASAPPVTTEALLHYTQLALGEVTRERTSAFRKEQLKTGDATTLNVFSAGKKTDPPVLLINAYGMENEFFEPLGQELSRDHFLMSWECRGLPDVSQPFDPADCGVESHVKDAVRVMEHFGVSEAHVIGWCSGAQVALRLASQQKERVRSLGLLTGSYRLSDAFPKSDFANKLLQFLPHCAKGVPYAKLYCELIFGGAAVSDLAQKESATLKENSGALASSIANIPESVIHLTSGPFKTPESLYRYAHLQLAFQKEPEHAWAQGIEVPTFVVGGIKDTIVNYESSVEVARRIPGADLWLSEAGDHFILYFDRTLADRWRKFLADTNRSAA